MRIWVVEETEVANGKVTVHCFESLERAETAMMIWAGEVSDGSFAYGVREYEATPVEGSGE